jgi:hypothetical protein
MLLKAESMRSEYELPVSARMVSRPSAYQTPFTDVTSWLRVLLTNKVVRITNHIINIKQSMIHSVSDLLSEIECFVC